MRSRIAKLVGRGIRGQRLAFDELQRKIRQSALGDSRVVQARDVWMSETGEDVALAREPFDELAVEWCGTQDFQRDRTLERAVRAACDPDRPHSATAKLPYQAVRSDFGPLQELPGGERLRECCGTVLRQAVEEVSRCGTSVGLQQCLDGWFVCGMLCIERLQPSRPRLCREVERFVEQRGDVSPVLCGDDNLRHGRLLTVSRHRGEQNRPRLQPMTLDGAGRHAERFGHRANG